MPIVLPEDHPGFHDMSYRAHRAVIADAARRFRPGDPLPAVAYTEAERGMWRTVSAELAGAHREHACQEYLAGADMLRLPSDRVPQLAEVSGALHGLTGFTLTPAADLVEARSFYGSLADRRFQATQYLRHPDSPMFSPEPDMIHEVIGHGVHLANRRIAELYRLIGETVRRLETPEAVALVSRIFWFTIEYGLVREKRRSTVIGASLLTSYGELQQYRGAHVRPLDAESMFRQKYRIDVFQPVLFEADSFNHLEDFLHATLTELDDGRSQSAAA
ncbi:MULTISPECIES: phenylalanine 4-monooxygenase [unclassified Streptomyces]|uniref:phenylalanine 4-monooxygenase n=1 Tax=unclassified Streptomyces TaxID=2593676 RepID=UPI00224F47AB|nr:MULTISPECIES: phenylalanine 4-monooxygenase [unclassified Streptomyces]MCX5191311.1 phenylalanine 4-monooxygenase [Streptomyces sp. NBC_00268]